MIKNLIFDFGKVLVDYDFDRLFRSIVADDDRRKVFADFLNDPVKVAIVDRGEIPLPEYIEQLMPQMPGYEDELREFVARKHEVVTGEIEGMKDLLRRYKKEGYRLYGLTNWDTVVYKTMEEYGEIFGLLDDRIISSEEHCIKPEHEIYKRLCSRFNLKPEECVFADDKVENIIGAREIGMHGIVFRNACQYEEQLLQIIDAEN